MIDFVGLFKYLLKQLWLILAIVLLAVGVTYFLTDDLPDSYYSETQISTGITELAKIDGSQTSNYMQVRQTYGNIMSMMTMKRVLGTVSHALAIHDLKDVGNAFRPYSENIDGVVRSIRQQILSELENRLVSGNVILTDKDEVSGVKLKDVIQWMGYGGADLQEGLSINRKGESDFITVGFASENPELSAFVVNTLSSEFIQYYHTFRSVNETKSVTLLDSLLSEKERVMVARNESLKNYRVSKGIMDASAQSSGLYQQITTLESQRAERLTEIQSLQGAIKDLNAQLNNPTSDYLRPTSSHTNNELLEIDRQLQAANRRYIDNNFNPVDKRMVDSLQRRRNAIAGSVPGSVSNSGVQVNRRSLEAELLQLETSLSLAKNGIASIEKELANVRSRYHAMVPMDAGLQNLQREADIATQEYMEILNRTNQAGFVSNVGLRLSIVEAGLPGMKMPSKRLLYVGFSGVATLVLCMSAFALLFLLDRRVVTKAQLGALTDGKVIGVINSLDKSYKGIRAVWDDNVDVDAVMYKDLLRSLRFDLNNEMNINKSRVLGITSLSPGAGKSFLAVSLAYAFAVTGKKVLLIGEQVYDFFGNADKTAQEAQHFEQFLMKREIQIEDLITTLTRNAHQNSLMELQDMENLLTGFGLLRDAFDIIIIDTDSCQNLNQVKEWLMFTDVSIGVFESGDEVSNEGKELMNYLGKHNGFLGWVLNKVKLSA
ncbi:exopolysaccharide transport family protein [Parapedobacter sp. 10938]|uniref:exopolysaccharide transport family protein n=1 Tax=Parapedobacter flavus TaxID=3110225 RepID=UPI002DBB1183|nr:Wzz/FepE/Etk N-terminal domain-containing protein [Parapedobacter sp. 10938]MEC3879899.1 Wzz/FepE/Etk N-terminal domain-containing protein [Parapedobacter sp. 10938]